MPRVAFMGGLSWSFADRVRALGDEQPFYCLEPVGLGGHEAL